MKKYLCDACDGDWWTESEASYILTYQIHRNQPMIQKHYCERHFQSRMDKALSECHRAVFVRRPEDAL